MARRVANLETLYARAGKGQNTLIGSVDEAIELIERADASDRERLRWDEAPAAVWLAVLQARPDLKDAVVLNKRLPVKVLEVLSRDEDSRIRFSVAMKRALPPKLQELLASDPDESVRARVAFDAKATTAVLKKLLEDPWYQAREGAEKTLRKRGEL